MLTETHAGRPPSLGESGSFEGFAQFLQAPLPLPAPSLDAPPDSEMCSSGCNLELGQVVDDGRVDGAEHKLGQSWACQRSPVVGAYRCGRNQGFQRPVGGRGCCVGPW